MAQFTPYQSRAMDLIKVDALRKDQQRQTRLDDLAFRKQDLAEQTASREQADAQNALVASTLGSVLAMAAEAPEGVAPEVFASGLEAMETQGLRLDQKYLDFINRNVKPALQSRDPNQLRFIAGALGADVSMPEAEGPNIGTYNPRDYTAESFAEFTRSGDPSALDRYEAVQVVDSPKGQLMVNRATGEVIGTLSTLEDAATEAETVAGATERGRAGVQSEVADAESQAEMMDKIAAFDTEATQWKDLIGSEDFIRAVGPLSGITQSGANPLRDRDAAVVGARAERASKRLVLKAAESLSGAMSDGDIKLLEDGAPKRSDPPEFWVDWYNFDFLGTVNPLREKAGLPPLPPMSLAGEDPEIDALVNKYTGGGG